MSLLASALTDWIGAAAAALTAAFAFAAVVQLFDIKRQTKQGALANVSESYGQISEGMAAFRSILFQQPEWYGYFFEGQDPRKDGLIDDDPRAGIQLELVCDEIVDLADTVIEQRHTVPGAEMDWSTWDAYFRFIYQNSPLLRRYLRENIGFYPDYVLTVFGYIIVRDEDTGEVHSEWRVDEWPSDRAGGREQESLDEAFVRCTGKPASAAELNGYPWFRTWVITKMGKESEEGTESDYQGPRLVAVASPDESDPETAEIKYAWCRSAGGGDSKNERELKKQAEPDLRSWVLEVLLSWVVEVVRASTRLKNARVFLDPQTEPQVVPLKSPRRVVWRKKLEDRWRKKPSRERYLAPVPIPRADKESVPTA